MEQDIQAGLDRGLVDPEVLKSFFELDQHPIIAELTRRYQVSVAHTPPVIEKISHGSSKNIKTLFLLHRYDLLQYALSFVACRWCMGMNK